MLMEQTLGGDFPHPRGDLGFTSSLPLLCSSTHVVEFKVSILSLHLVQLLACMIKTLV